MEKRGKYEVLLGKMRQRGRLENQDVDGRIMKLILKKQAERTGSVLLRLRIRIGGDCL